MGVKTTCMSIPRLAGLVVGLILSLIFLTLTVVALQLSWGDSTASRNPLWLLPVILPLLFSLWVVYRSFCTNDMDQLEILWWIVRPQALKRTVFAEACVSVVVFCLFMGLLYVLKHSV